MSTVRTNNVQVGQSVTATNNFTLYQPATPDGTVRLGVGNSGATTADVITATSAGNVGIGTSSPSGRLNVQDAVSAGRMNVTFLNNTGGNTSNRMRIRMAASSGFSGTDLYPYIEAYEENAGNAAEGLAFGTYNGSSLGERARIDAGGNFFVGKTGANDNTNGFAVYNIGASIAGALSIAATTSDNTSSGFRQYSTGAGAYRFYVGYGGTINATSTSISGISDQSLKENIRDLETGLPQVLALRPRRFDWKEETKIGEKNVAGFIAQEVEQVLPELVYDYQYSENVTKKSLKMGDILPTLVKAIQELKAELDSVKAELAALKGV